jgi:broad specificity phosphatase PhoE
MARTDDFRVLLVRSGPTDWDDAGRLQGETDLPLSDCGKEAFAARVAEIARQAEDHHVEAVLHGPDECSSQSARMLGAQLHARPRQVEDFREMDLGLWEGRRESELLEKHPTVYRQWRQDPTAVTPPDGDTLADTELRVLRALRKQLEKSGKTGVAIVLRPVAFGIVRCWLADRPLDEMWDVVNEAPEGEWFVIPKDRLKDLAVELKAGT